MNQPATDNRNFRALLGSLWRTIPTAKRKRTARGRLRTCRELGESIRFANRLHKWATCDDDHRAIDALAAEYQSRRTELADGGLLAQRVRLERQARRRRRPMIAMAKGRTNG